MNKHFLLIIFCLITIHLNAQIEKTKHFVFELDSIATFMIDVADEYTVENWPGNTMMVETNIQLYSGNPNIFKSNEKEGRYDFLGEVSGQNIRVYPKVANRKAIQTKSSQVFESVKLKIFIPEDFESSDQKNFTRNTIPPAFRE